MHFKISFLLLICLIFCYKLYSQENLTELEFIAELAEEFVAINDQGADYSVIYDDLTDLYNNPLNLNYSEADEFEKLHILNKFQIYSITNYRETNGLFLSVYELAYVYGFTEEIVKKILPFISVSTHKPEVKLLSKGLFPKGKQELWMRSQQIIEKQNGYIIEDSAKTENNYYLGSPVKIYIKYRYSYNNNIFAGITAEKDQGEEFFIGSNQTGFDFYSGYYQIKNYKWINNFIIGDYHNNIGQGLVIWPGYSTGKSIYILNTAKTNQGIQRKSSINENQFLRGIAGSIKKDNTIYTVYFSTKNIDANVTLMDSLTQNPILFSSFQNSGLHNTVNYTSDKKSIYEIIYGTSCEWKNEILKIGGSFNSFNYNAGYEPQAEPYNNFKNLDLNNYYTSIFYNLHFKYSNFFGEYACQINHGYSFLNGVLLKAAPRFELSILQRYFDKKYYSPYSNAFGENSVNNNESGIYTGCNIYLFRNWKLTAYYDLYKFSWLKYQLNSPSTGNDYLIQLNYTLSDYFNMYLRYKEKTKIKQFNSTIDNNILFEPYYKKALRYHINYKISDVVYFKNRIEILNYQIDDNIDKGFLFYQDIIIKPVKPKFSLYFRYSVFDTDTYDTRIYAYENDVLYAFSIPAYYNKGIRYYIMLKYKFGYKLDTWIRFSQTSYSDRNIIGSGITQINGNTKSEIKVQLRYKF